jgi:rhodanese-related sulfurtransferase
MPGAPKIRDLTPHDVQTALDNQEILLIDVREPEEFAAARIAGAVNMPLSTFDPAALPPAEGKMIVFQCGSGKRSAAAVAACQTAGQAHDAHLGGGLMAWVSQGLPTI